MDLMVRLLHELVAIDSVNPSLVPGGAGEAEIADRIAADLRAQGLDVDVFEAAPGRPNVVGILEGHGPGRSLMLCGHMDTVGVAGMEAPFVPSIHDGKLYGRGAQDMKGGLAAMLGASRTVAEGKGLAAGRLIVAAVADEEHASLGAEALIRRYGAEAAIVPEPTDLVIATGHKGFSWIEIVAEGIAAHGSRPGDGRDAIMRMGRILGRLEALDHDLQSRPRHPIQGTASLHASRISGGREWSTYPDRCLLHLERRTITGETEETGLAEVEEILQDLRGTDCEFRASAKLLFDRRPYETPAGHYLISALQEVLGRIGRRGVCGGVSFWTDASVLGHAGIPSVIFGPGGAGLHGVEEYVILDEVLACRDALVELIRTTCSENNTSKTKTGHELHEFLE